MWPRRFVVYPIVFTLVGIALTYVTNAAGWTHEPLWLGAIRGAVLGIGMPVLEFATSKGWIDGVFFSPSTQEALRKKRESLEQQRQDTLSEFQERHHRES